MNPNLSLPLNRPRPLTRLFHSVVATAMVSATALTATLTPASAQTPQAAPTTQPQPPAQTQAVQTNPAQPNSPAGSVSGKPLTVTGCLQPAQEGQAGFQLIVSDTKQSTTNAKAVTTAYALTANPQIDLQGHVNELVELTGAELPVPAQTAALTDRTRSTSEPAAVGTSGRPGTATTAGAARTTPTVETTTKAEIVAKAMTVSGVKTVATRCP